MSGPAVIQSHPLIHTRGLAALTISFLVISVSVETVYSWQSLADAYYLVKVFGWSLLAWGLTRISVGRRIGLTFLASGWAWLAANFWRAIADRINDLNAGESLRLGSIELLFAGSCLAVCIGGLVWSLARANRNQN
jgi:hypothetical protein